MRRQSIYAAVISALAFAGVLVIAIDHPADAQLQVDSRWTRQGHDVYTKRVQNGDSTCLLVVMDHPADIQYDDVTVSCP